MKESQEAILSILVALESNQKRGVVTGDQSDEDEEKEGENENPQGVQCDDELDPNELRMAKLSKAIKGDILEVKMKFPMYGRKMDNEEVLDWVDAQDNYFE